jgi:hypothetical protein
LVNIGELCCLPSMTFSTFVQVVEGQVLALFQVSTLQLSQVPSMELLENMEVLVHCVSDMLPSACKVPSQP